MTQIQWSELACSDLQTIDDYWLRNAPGRADWVLDTIEAAASVLMDMPRVGTPIPGLDIRKWRVRGTDYILFYRIAADDVQILRVFHDRQDWLPRA